jgi:hypothetical protein
MNDFISSVKNIFFAKKLQDTDRNNSDDYMIRKSKKFDIVIKIVAVVGAIIIWLCAVTSGSAVNQRMFTYNNFEIKGTGSFISAAERSGFSVIINYDNTVSFSLKGRKRLIDSLNEKEVSVYVDLTEYIETVNTIPNDTTQIIEADIEIKVPGYFQISNVSLEKITIQLIPIN